SQLRPELEAQRQPQNLALAEPLADGRRRIAFEHPKVLLEHLSKRPVGDAASVREAAAAAEQRLLRFGSEPIPELADETRLSDPRVAHDRHEMRLSPLDGPLIRCSQELQLRLPADEGAAKAADAARSRQGQGAQKAPACDPPRFALRLGRCGIAELEGTPRRSDGALTDQDLSRRSRFLEPCGDVDGVAGREGASLARPSGHYLARI